MVSLRVCLGLIEAFFRVSFASTCFGFQVYSYHLQLGFRSKTHLVSTITVQSYSFRFTAMVSDSSAWFPIHLWFLIHAFSFRFTAWPFCECLALRMVRLVGCPKMSCPQNGGAGIVVSMVAWHGTQQMTWIVRKFVFES